MRSHKVVVVVSVRQLKLFANRQTTVLWTTTLSHRSCRFYQRFNSFLLQTHSSLHEALNKSASKSLKVQLQVYDRFISCLVRWGITRNFVAMKVHHKLEINKMERLTFPNIGYIKQETSFAYFQTASSFQHDIKSGFVRNEELYPEAVNRCHSLYVDFLR